MCPRPAARRRSAVVGALAAAALLLTGCSGGGDAKDSSSAGSSSSSADAPSSSSGDETASASASASASPQGEPFTTVKGFVDDTEVTLDVYPLRRNGDLVVLQLRMNVSPQAEDSSQVAATFDDGDGETGSNDLDSLDGLELVDGENGKVYLVATDTDHRCLCSEGLGSAIVDPGQSVTLDASFAAPPEDVSSVDLRIPSFGTTADVPVQ